MLTDWCSRPWETRTKKRSEDPEQNNNRRTRSSSSSSSSFSPVSHHRTIKVLRLIRCFPPTEAAEFRSSVAERIGRKSHQPWRGRCEFHARGSSCTYLHGSWGKEFCTAAGFLIRSTNHLVTRAAEGSLACLHALQFLKSLRSSHFASTQLFQKSRDPTLSSVSCFQITFIYMKLISNSKPCSSTNTETGTLVGASNSVQPADSSLEKYKADSQISSKNIYFPHHYLQKYHVCLLLMEHLSVQTFSHLSLHHVALFKPWIPPKSAVWIKLYRQPLSVSVKKWVWSSTVKK